MSKSFQMYPMEGRFSKRLPWLTVMTVWWGPNGPFPQNYGRGTNLNTSYGRGKLLCVLMCFLFEPHSPAGAAKAVIIAFVDSWLGPGGGLGLAPAGARAQSGLRPGLGPALVLVSRWLNSGAWTSVLKLKSKCGPAEVGGKLTAPPQ